MHQMRTPLSNTAIVCTTIRNYGRPWLSRADLKYSLLRLYRTNEKTCRLFFVSEYDLFPSVSTSGLVGLVKETFLWTCWIENKHKKTLLSTFSSTSKDVFQSFLTYIEFETNKLINDAWSTKKTSKQTINHGTYDWTMSFAFKRLLFWTMRKAFLEKKLIEAAFNKRAQR